MHSGIGVLKYNLSPRDCQNAADIDQCCIRLQQTFVCIASHEKFMGTNHGETNFMVSLILPITKYLIFGKSMQWKCPTYIHGAFNGCYHTETSTGIDKYDKSHTNSSREANRFLEFFTRQIVDVGIR